MVTIAGRTVGPGSPCFLIAEAGVNHNGDIALARRLVDAAAAAGADAVKFQTFRAEAVAAPSAPKAGLVQLTRYLATALAPDVRVNALSPGGIERGQPDAFRERYRARTPLRRLATEEDVKGAVLFLASDLSAYVTGHNLVVDGGWTAW